MDLWYRAGSPTVNLKPSPSYPKAFHLHQEQPHQGIGVFSVKDGRPNLLVAFYPIDTWPTTSEDFKTIYRINPTLLSFARSGDYLCYLCPIT